MAVVTSTLPRPTAGAGHLVAELRAVRVVWQRELIRFSRNRVRILTSVVQPILFLFVLGTGLSAATPASGVVDYRTFMFPGIVAMTVLFTAIFSAVSIVWDREFGFLREMLVAPVARQSLLVGKTLGGATVATLQGAIMLVFAGAVHVPYDPALLATLPAEMALTAVTVTAIGVLLASRIRQMEAFQGVLQFLVMPMFFLSGAVFPVNRLPAWLAVLTKIDPLTYAVDPMRRAVFSYLDLPPGVTAQLAPGVSWHGWPVPTAVELGLLAVVGVVALLAAVTQFRRAE